MANKRALLVAINDYPGNANDLPSCVNDAKAMEATAKDSFGFAETKMLLDSDATIAKVETELKWLFKDAAPDDILFFFYSGHGYQAPKNGVMEESLVFHDGFFADDKLVALTKDLPAGVLTVCLDSCFSGGMEKRVFEFIEEIVEVARNKFWVPETAEKIFELFSAEKTVTKYRPFGCFPVDLKWSPKGLRKAFKALKSADDDEEGQPQLNGLLITASSENETAAASTSATSGMSAFTWAFRTVLSTASQSASADYLVSAANGILKQAGFRQTPLVKASPGHLSNRAFLSGRIAEKGFTFNAGGNVSTPVGGGGFGVGFGTKAWQDLIGPIVTEVVRELSKGQPQEEKLFGIDDAILIPAIASIVAAAVKQKGFSFNAGGGLSTPVGGGGFGVGFGTKAWQDLIGPIVTEVVRELSKGQPQEEKLFGIDDAILIPAIASIVAAAVKQKGFSFNAGGGLSTPVGGGGFGVGFGTKAWQDLIGPIVTEVVRELSKGQPQEEKLFGIDDAILIPAIASIVAAAVKQKGFSFNAGGGLSTPVGGGGFGVGFGTKAWQDLIGPIVTEVVRELSKGRQKSMVLPNDLFSGNDLLDRIRCQLAGRT